MNEYLSFRKMITPAIIQILFFVGAAICVISRIIGIIAGAASDYGSGRQVLGGLFTLILGPIIIGLLCELVLGACRILDALQEIRDGKASSNSVPTDQE